MLRRLTPLFAVAALALTAAACGGDDDDTTATTAETAATTATTTGGGTGTTVPSTASATTAPAGTDGEPVDADAEDYVDALLAQIDVGDNGECIAAEFVDAVGADELSAAGVTPEEFADASSLEQVGITLDDAEADELEATLAECGGLVDLVLGLNDATPEQEACADEHLTEEIAADAFVATFRGTEPGPEARQAAADFQACIAEGGD